MKYAYKKILPLTIIIFFLSLPLWNLPDVPHAQEITDNTTEYNSLSDNSQNGNIKK